MPVGAYEANCIILWDDSVALVVDPGQDAEDILAFLSARSLELKAVLLTHGHFDHTGAVNELRETLGIPV
jgi:glyoxylase-like metal-dependent hydrolase (beta-lactamase superfamily II)